MAPQVANPCPAGIDTTSEMKNIIPCSTVECFYCYIGKYTYLLQGSAEDLASHHSPLVKRDQASTTAFILLAIFGAFVVIGACVLVGKCLPPKGSNTKRGISEPTMPYISGNTSSV